MNKSCPLGHVCDQCLWEVEVQKVHAQTQEVAMHKGCALIELVNAQISTFQQTHSVGASMDSLRNHIAQGNQFLAAAVQKQRLTHEQG